MQLKDLKYTSSKKEFLELLIWKGRQGAAPCHLVYWVRSAFVPSFFFKGESSQNIPFFSLLLSFLLDIGHWRVVECWVEWLRGFWKKNSFMQRFRLQKCSHDDTSTSQKQNIRTCYFAPLTMARLFRLPSSHRRRRRGEEDNVRRNHFGRRQQ